MEWGLNGFLFIIFVDGCKLFDVYVCFFVDYGRLSIVIVICGLGLF